jgi:hypothetical protein
LTNDKALFRAIIKIYERQTLDEQEAEETSERNGVGFSGCDANILSSFAKQLIVKGYLSPKQITIARKKMPKYWKQIQSLIEEKQSAY